MIDVPDQTIPIHSQIDALFRESNTESTFENMFAPSKYTTKMEKHTITVNFNGDNV